MEPVLNRMYGLLFTAMLLATPASGTSPVIATPLTATICDVATCVMIPGYRVSDDDGDTLTYAITPALAGASIDTNTGLITASATLSAGSYTLVVTDTNGDSDSKLIAFIVFTDANAPTIGGTFTASVAENVVVGTTVTTSYTASGEDTGDGVTYAISGTDVALFKIGLFDGVLKTVATLDFEAKSILSVELTVKDSKRTPSSAQTLTITVTDADEAPVCNPDTIAKNMADGAAIGTKVETLSCNDPDAGATIAYAIATGDPNSYFSVSAGVITVAKVLDRATFASYALSVTATSSGKSDTVTVAVTVLASASDAINKASRLYIVAGLLLLMKYYFE